MEYSEWSVSVGFSVSKTRLQKRRKNLLGKKTERKLKWFLFTLLSISFRFRVDFSSDSPISSDFSRFFLRIYSSRTITVRKRNIYFLEKERKEKQSRHINFNVIIWRVKVENPLKKRALNNTFSRNGGKKSKRMEIMCGWSVNASSFHHLPINSIETIDMVHLIGNSRLSTSAHNVSAYTSALTSIYMHKAELTE